MDFDNKKLRIRVQNSGRSSKSSGFNVRKLERINIWVQKVKKLLNLRNRLSPGEIERLKNELEKHFRGKTLELRFWHYFFLIHQRVTYI